MKLATDEQILKTYNYASVGKVSDTLTVTNKRVVVSTEGKLSDGSKIYTTDEIMLKSIEKVSSALITKRSPIFIVVALLMTLISAILYLALNIGYLSFIPLLPAFIFVIVFFANKKKSFYLVLTTSLLSGMDLSLSVGNWKRKKSNKTVKVNVDETYAFEIIEEIGSIIVEAKTQD